MGPANLDDAIPFLGLYRDLIAQRLGDR